MALFFRSWFSFMAAFYAWVVLLLRLLALLICVGGFLRLLCLLICVGGFLRLLCLLICVGGFLRLLCLLICVGGFLRLLCLLICIRVICFWDLTNIVRRLIIIYFNNLNPNFPIKNILGWYIIIEELISAFIRFIFKLSKISDKDHNNAKDREFFSIETYFPWEVQRY